VSFAVFGGLAVLWLGTATLLWAQPPVAPDGTSLLSQAEDVIRNDWAGQVDSLRLALIRLPIAAALSAVLAFRPRRRGTPARQVAVIQTQIILAIVGAIVMLVVGASLARAFGIVGAAGLIRYRAKIDDPKDAGVMLSTLALGLASGVGLYLLALFAMTFVLIVLWILESIEPEPITVFDLTVCLPAAADKREAIEQVLRRSRVKFELRGSSAEDVKFEVRVPQRADLDRLSTAIAAIDTKQTIDVKWDKKKDK
jgi:uncharacterized membrane protein YhiD involved in acid resistance